MAYKQEYIASKRRNQGVNVILQLLSLLVFLLAGYWFLYDSEPRYDYAPSLTGIMSEAYTGDAPADTVTSLDFPFVLCYHQIRNWNVADAKNDRDYIVPLQLFKAQMKLLYDSGYHTILPGQWIDHLQHGTPLPGKPFLLTFDDGTQSQYDNALPELTRYGYKAIFFIMTVTLDKPKYISRKQVRYLSDQDQLIGCHTWDHHDVRTYSEADWKIQLAYPTRELEQITGKPVQYFAYPFGCWNPAAVAHLKAQGYLMAFQLGGRTDTADKAFTIRRILVDGHWNSTQLMKAIASFNHNKFSDL